MQKNTTVWLLASALSVSCLLNTAFAANQDPGAGEPSALDASTVISSIANDLQGASKLDTPGYSPEQSRQQLQLLINGGPWLSDDRLSGNSQQLIRAIQNSASHGLNPEHYGLKRILRMADSLNEPEQAPAPIDSAPRSKNPRNTEQLRHELSAQMDRSFVQLATHLGTGVVDASSTQRSLFREAPQIDTAALLESIWSRQSDIVQALAAVAPASQDYQRLTTRMRNLLTERAAGIARPVLGEQLTLAEPMSHPDVMSIKQRLVESGELPLDTRMTPLFDAQLSIALQQFQKRHGLQSDGRVGSLTRKALNLSIDDEIQAVALSLERWRWMPRELGAKHLLINIPNYRVEYRDDEEVKMSMIAVVGAKEHPTPTFSQDMSYMEFNPTWTVPTSITNAELIPRELSQPGYLVSRQFEFLKRVNDDVVVIPPESVTAADYQTKPFPYTLRQRGSAINSLGKVKFMMPNPYAIYLHDTPQKNLFALNDRAFSHGCIRLSDPDAMATLLMTEDGYNDEQIQQALHDKGTSRVSFRSHIPTHLTYMTTWIDSEGVLQRRPDVYHYDSALLIALQTSDTVLSILNQPVATL